MAPIVHRAGGTTRLTLALSYFALLAFLGFGGAMVYRSLVTPPTRTISCERSTGRCSGTGQVFADETVSFPITQLAGLEVGRDGSRAWLAWVHGRSENVWTVETSDAAQIAELERAVASMHAFAAGEGETLTVVVPNGGPTRNVLLGLFVVVFGLLQILIQRRLITRTTIELGDPVRITSSRGIGPGLRAEIPRATIRGVTLRVDQSGRYRRVVVELAVEGAPPTTIVTEYWSTTAEAAAKKLVDDLRTSLGLPATAA